jgi:hypothetical protein
MQILYNGILWSNKYRRIKGDQFLYNNLFLPGTVSINGQTFKNLRIRYDIYSDEISTPLNREEIMQLNKEKVDSFTIYLENKINRFIKIYEDTLKSFNGYVNVLYKGKSALYVKYKKEISPAVTSQYDGEFYQTQQIYFMKGNTVFLIKSPKDLFKVLNENADQLKTFIKTNKIRISKTIPESYIPVIKYYDSISQ